MTVKTHILDLDANIVITKGNPRVKPLNQVVEKWCQEGYTADTTYAIDDDYTNFNIPLTKEVLTQYNQIESGVLAVTSDNNSIEVYVKNPSGAFDYTFINGETLAVPCPSQLVLITNSYYYVAYKIDEDATELQNALRDANESFKPSLIPFTNIFYNRRIRRYGLVFENVCEGSAKPYLETTSQAIEFALNNPLFMIQNNNADLCPYKLLDEYNRNGLRQIYMKVFGDDALPSNSYWNHHHGNSGLARASVYELIWYIAAKIYALNPGLDIDDFYGFIFEHFRNTDSLTTYIDDFKTLANKYITEKGGQNWTLEHD